MSIRVPAVGCRVTESVWVHSESSSLPPSRSTAAATSLAPLGSGLVRHQRGRGQRGGSLKVRAPRCLKKPRAPATAQSLWRCALAGRAGIGSVPCSRRARCSFHSVRARSGLCPERWPDERGEPEGSVPSSCCAKPPAATGKLRASALVLASPISQTVPYPKRQNTPLPRLEVTKVARAGRSARAPRLPLNILGTLSNVSSLPT